MGKKRKPWYASAGYKHFDAQIGKSFASRATKANFVAAHSWLPLIKYTKRVKRYKSKANKTVFKDRQIMYSSHRDACILKHYARITTELLDVKYKATTLDRAVIAYRALGRAMRGSW